MKVIDPYSLFQIHSFLIILAWLLKWTESDVYCNTAVITSLIIVFPI